MKISNPEFKLPETFQSMPEAEKYAFVKEQIAKTPAPQSEDPFINSYMKAKEAGLSQQDFLQQQNLSNTVKNMGSKEFLINDLMRENGKTAENPGGWDESDVISHVEGLDMVTLDLKAKERKEKILTDLDTQTEQYKVKVAEQIKTQAEAANSGPIIETVNKLFSNMATVKDIGGIPHTPKDQADFRQMFTDAVSINPETGYSRTRELFNNDEVLYKSLYLYSKVAAGDNTLRNFLSNYKEEYKQSVLDKTGLAPRQQGGELHTIAVPSAGDHYV